MVSFFDSEVEQAMEPRSRASAVGVAEIGHETIRDQLSEYSDDSLPDGERARVEEHLARCRACRAYRATLEATRRAVAALPRATAPASAKERLLDIAGG